MAVISRRANDFNKLFAVLPAHIQALAVKNFLLWKQNPWHPSLNFEEWQPGRWSARVGAHYRALAVKRFDGAMLWYWTGTHEAYNKLIRR